MELSFASVTYLGIFGILGFQLISGLFGMRAKNSLRTLQLYLFLLFLSSELSRSFFPVYVTGLAGGFADKEMTAALPQIVWGLSALVATPLGWALAKKIGVKNIYLITSLATATALSVTAITDNYWLMLFCRAIVSAGYGIANIVAAIYLLREGVRSRSLAVLLVAIATASICGSSLGGLLTSHVAYSNVFWLSALCAALSGSVMCLSFSEAGAVPLKRQPRVTYGKLLGNLKIQLFAVLSTMPYRFVLTGFVLYLLPTLLTKHQISLQTVGQIMMVYFLLNYVLVTPVASLLDRFGGYRTLAVIGTLLTGAGFLLLSFWLNTLAVIYLAVAVISIGMTLNNSVQIPSVPVVFPKECETFGQDILVAYFRTVERIGSVIGPLLTALLYRLWADRTLQVVGGSLILIAVLLAGLFIFQKDEEGTTTLDLSTVC